MFTVLLSAILAFGSPNEVQNAVSQSVFQSIERSHKIALVEFDPSTNQITGKILKQFENNDLILLKSYLLDGSSYHFNKTKTCLFIPQYALTFSDSEDVVILISPSGKQLKFQFEGKSKILDYDPMSDFMDRLLVL